MEINIILCLILCILLNYNLKAQSNSNYRQNNQNNNIFGEKEEDINNFTGYIYYLPENTIKLPDFSKLIPVGEIYTNSLNVKEQDFDQGFPGVTDRFEYFAIDYIGKFYLEDSCFYCFILGSDDGSKLYIDESLVIDNDYTHAFITKTNCISLSKGLHKIEVQYFQGPRYSVGLILCFKKIDDRSYQIFNLSQFYPILVNDNDSTIDISIGDEILFDFNSYELNKKAKHVLSEMKRIIIDKTKIESIIIEGHTDDIGSEEYNLVLSINRANAVKLFLTEIGVDSKYIITKGYGKTKPKFPNIDNENRKKNRRIEMSIIKSK
ncbi:MAG: OmpA family protein [Bacteroidales bacterium]|nr:OmpA family protein [Bacteroidales bacterium]